jgi:hypothetical protein
MDKNKKKTGVLAMFPNFSVTVSQFEDVCECHAQITFILNLFLVSWSCCAERQFFSIRQAASSLSDY